MIWNFHWASFLNNNNSQSTRSSIIGYKELVKPGYGIIVLGFDILDSDACQVAIKINQPDKRAYPYVVIIFLSFWTGLSRAFDIWYNGS